MIQNEYLIKKAEAHEKEGQLIHAIQIYKKIYEDETVRRTVLIKLISIYEKLNNVNAALNLIDEYLLVHDDIEVRKIYTHYLVRHGFYEKALDVVSEVSKEDYPEILFLIGMANYNLEEYNFSKINFSDFIKRNKSSELLPEALIYLAKVNIKQNDLDLALDNLRLAENISTRNLDLYKTYAETYIKKSMFIHANEAIQKAFELEPSEMTLQKIAAKIMFELSEFKQAEFFLKNYIKNSQAGTDDFNLLAKTYEKLNRKKEADLYFKKAKEAEEYGSN